MVGLTSIHLPEGAVLVVETVPDSKSQFYLVEYNGERDRRVREKGIRRSQYEGHRRQVRRQRRCNIQIF